jgi:hypothetical protein
LQGLLQQKEKPRAKHDHQIGLRRPQHTTDAQCAIGRPDSRDERGNQPETNTGG